MNNNFENSDQKGSEIAEKLTELRAKVHAEMEKEIEERLKQNPTPSENELRMGAFVEWLEPQVRNAVIEMYKKGYGSASSGFYGEDSDFQAIDGYFSIDDETKQKIELLGAQVLNGEELGLPLNKSIRQIRFYPDDVDMKKMKEKWDAIAALLPERKDGPPATCDRSEEFREEYAPQHPSMEEGRNNYFDFISGSENS